MVYSSFSQNISIEVEANLESPKPLTSCVCLDSITNDHNPADIFTGLLKCIELKKYNRAAQYFALAGVYGRFDSYRVKDNTAHQAVQVIQLEAFSTLTEKQKGALLNALNEELERGSENLKNNCGSLSNIGMPSYYPTYMIQHGISAFTDEKGNALVEDFNSNKAWEDALNGYLHCNE